MEEFLVLLFQFAVELLLECLGSMPWDLISYRWEEKNPGFVIGILAFGAGCLLGVASLLFFPKTMLHHDWSRMGNLIFAPLLSGSLARYMALLRKQRGREVSARRHFWHSFWFTLGLALIRFTYAARV